jgi:hypothetical protein
MFTPRVDATHASARAGARLLNTTNRQTEKWQQQCRQNQRLNNENLDSD